MKIAQHVVLILLVCLGLVLVWAVAWQDSSLPPRIELSGSRQPELFAPASLQESGRQQLPEVELGPAPDEPTGKGTILGTVADDWRQPVAGVRVLLVGSEESAETDLDGKFRFDVTPGTYRPEVDVQSLAIGVYLPPMENSVGQSVFTGADGKEAAVLTVTANDVLHITFELHHQCVVQGRILTSTGSGVWGVDVELQCVLPSRQYLAYRARTDRHGSFELQDVVPGRYRLESWLIGAPEQYRSLSRPIPPDVEIQFGTTVLDDVVLGSGPGTVRGRVVDQDGRPFPGLQVICYPKVEVPDGDVPYGMTIIARDETGQDGSFSFAGLPAAKIAVAVDPYGFLPFRQFYGKPPNRLAAHVEQVIVDVAQQPVRDLGTITAIVNRPFTFKGRVELGPECHGQGFGRTRARLTLVAAPGHRAAWVGLPLRQDGTFEWKFDAPESPPFEVWIKVSGFVVAKVPVTPVPGGELYQIISTP